MTKDTILEAYMTMLAEMPQIITADTPEKIAASAKGLRDYIKANHHKSTIIDKAKKYHHIKLGESDLYYRHDGDNSKEMSFISKNIQSGTEKGPGGDSSHIHNFMLHHLKHNGSIESSNSNTDGSKNLWTKFIKNNPHLNHSAYNKTENTNTKLTATNIDDKSDKIWGKDNKFANIRIISKS